MVYKSVLTFLPVVFTLFTFIGVMLISVPLSLNAYAQQADLYTIEGVTVDVTADNAINARKQAFEQAQLKAFKQLTDRMLDGQDSASFQALEPSKISRLVKNFEVTKEQLTPTRYAGTYTFQFDENGIRSLFVKRQTTYVDTASKPVLILPFFKRDLKTTLWGASNQWMHAWAGAKNMQSLVPTVVPLGDLDDVSDISDNAISGYDFIRLTRMLNRYNAEDAIFVLASADDLLNQSLNGNEESLAGLLRVTLYRATQGQVEQFDQFSMAPEPGQDSKAFMLSAVKRTKNLLKKDWRSKAEVTPAPLASGRNQSIDVSVRVSSLAEWADIRNRLAKSAAVNDVRVNTLSPRYVDVSLQYYGDLQRLVFDFEQMGLTLKRLASQRSEWGKSNTGDRFILMKKSSYEALPSKRYSRSF